jgi:hypothetical protein
VAPAFTETGPKPPGSLKRPVKRRGAPRWATGNARRRNPRVPGPPSAEIGVPASITARYRQAPILLGARNAPHLAGASAPVGSARSRPLGRCLAWQLAARVKRTPQGRRQTDRLGTFHREASETREGSTVRPPSEASLLAEDTSSGRVGTPATRSCRSRVPQSSRPCCTLHAGRRDADTRHARDQPSRSDVRPPVTGNPSGAPAQGTHARTGAPRGASGRARLRDSSRRR